MRKKRSISMTILEMVLLVFQLVGMLVVCASIYLMACGTYTKACEMIEKKLLMR